MAVVDVEHAVIHRLGGSCRGRGTASVSSVPVHSCVRLLGIAQAPKVAPKCLRDAGWPGAWLHSFVQTSSCPRANCAASQLLLGRQCALRASRAASRSRERMREEKTEGKIKGPARGRPQSQSARGFGATRRRVATVPSRNAMPIASRVGGAHLPTHCVVPRRGVRHGHA